MSYFVSPARGASSLACSGVRIAKAMLAVARDASHMPLPSSASVRRDGSALAAASRIDTGSSSTSPSGANSRWLQAGYHGGDATWLIGQCGDVNGDGFTNATDGLIIAYDGCVEVAIEYGDVDGDGFCNVTDALSIARGEQGSSYGDQQCPPYNGQ